MDAPSAKDIRVEPISPADANALVRRVHYSGKIAPNSHLHLGVFLNGMLEGAMQFGPSMDKKKIIPLVSGTGWNGFLELNRMAFGPALPRNSESRAIAVAMRMIRKAYPHVEWIVSFADATQCGDGTIYRASGFVLTGLKKNVTLWDIGGQIVADMSVKHSAAGQDVRRKVISNMTVTKGKHILENGAASMKVFRDAGGAPLPGFQLRYIYFLNPAARARLTVPEIPFSEIDRAGARMYLGRKGEPACQSTSNASADSSIASAAQASAGRSPSGTMAAKQPSAPAGDKISAGEVCDGPSKGTATGQRRSTRSKPKAKKKGKR